MKKLLSVVIALMMMVTFVFAEEAAPAEVKTLYAGVLTVGCEAGYPPFEMVADDGESVVGLDMDIMAAVAEKLGLQMQVVTTSFDGIFDGIGVNYDVVCSAVTITPDRMQNMLFSLPYITNYQAVVVPADKDVEINSFMDLDGYVIGVQKGTTADILMGDYESGYERRLPDPVKDLKVTRMDWEAAMTIPENQWGYHKDWTLSYVKTNPEVLENVVHAVSMGGNMLVNFGPQGNGDFRPEEKQLAQYIGKWMKENGEAIYGCGYAGLTKQSWGYFTKNHQDEIYMIVFNRPVSDMLKVAVPKGLKVTGAQLLHKQELKVYETTTNQYNVSMKGVNSEGPWVIKLKTESGEQKNSYSKALI